MSNCSTPAPGPSAAASPSPVPPASRNSPSNVTLTPRSKVKALLAEFSSDSDDAQPAARKRVPEDASRVDHASPNNDAQVLHDGSGAKRVDSGNESEEHDELSIMHAPRGRMASRMWAEKSDGTAPGLPSEEGEGQDAYERIKRQLMASKEANEKTQVDAEPSTSQKLVDAGNASQERNADLASPPPARPGRRSPSALSDSKRSRRSTPGLFVSPRNSSGSPRNQPLAVPSDSESDLPDLPSLTNRLQALVARKREERLAKEKERGQRGSSPDSSDEEVSRKPKAKKNRRVEIQAESEADDDDEAAQKLTQQARPTRKASKKALEEMNRETQRMSRNMQLTHEAKTKTKFTTEAFFKKFNFRQPTIAEDARTEGEGAAATASSSLPATSDAENGQKHTPASSPPSLCSPPRKPMTVNELADAGLNDTEPMRLDEDDDALPDLADILSGRVRQRKSVERDATAEQSPSPTARPNRPSIRKLEKSSKRPTDSAGSDDDLEIVESKKPSRLPVFDNISVNKVKDSHSLHALRALADLNSHDKQRPRAGQRSLTASELQRMLHRRAREQARMERDEKIRALREKGVVVQTAEEKEQDQLQLENMLEKARKEADDLRKKEKEAAKKDGRDADGETHFMDSEDDDEDYDGSDEGDVELSGSEEENAQSEPEADVETEASDQETADGAENEEYEDEEMAEAPNALVDGEAEEDESEQSEDAAEVNVDGASGDEEAVARGMEPKESRIRRKRVIVSDDEDDEDAVPEGLSQLIQQTEAMLAPPKSSTADAFGFANGVPAPVGLSQVFQGTMAEDSSQDADDTQEACASFFADMPPPTIPPPDLLYQNPSESFLVQDSQPKGTQQQDSIPALVHFETQSQLPLETQASQAPEPTQDVGFQVANSPANVPPGSYNTIDTMLLSGVEVERSPTKKRGRLQRGRTLDASISESQHNAEQIGGDAVSANAFDVLRKAAKNPVDPDAFDKGKSKAKEMVEEQAEESEDEYAGLGGASDDDDNGEMDEETKKLIDDEGNEIVDERQIAAFHADKERADDEKLAERLYRDIANGGLRRKRGAEMDLWESDDEDEAAARRRAAKQREFAKMRKALLADEKIGKIAENPKQQAFLKAIEDREDDDDLSFLEEFPEEPSQIPDSQEANGSTQPNVLQPISVNPRKRKFDDSKDAEAVGQFRMPEQKRRANVSTKPTSLVDIRNTLSEMIGESQSSVDAESLPTPDHSDGDRDDADGERAHRSSLPSRRTVATTSRKAVIDRMALKRTESSASTAQDASSSRLAFQAPSKASHSNLRIPSLLRRATTGSSGNESRSAADRSAAHAAAGGKEAVKMGGSKKSSVNYYVREGEKRARLEEVERERREGRERVGRMRRSGMGLGALAGGQFD